jgi:hypothetical protein
MDRNQCLERVELTFVSQPFQGIYVIIMAQLVETMRDKLEGRVFDSGWRSLGFFSAVIRSAALWPWVRLSLQPK